MTMTVTRELLRDDILAELDIEPRVRAERIGVAVKSDGTVTLSGTVPTLGEKWAAEDAVKRLKGVKAVALEIEVDLQGNHQRTDTDIASTISNAFAWDTLLPDTLRVTVEKGHVTLEGEVEWQYQRQDAENVARRITGVRGVTNTLTLRHAVAAKDIQKELHRIFLRDAQFDADSVQVSIAGGKVTLAGKVRSWFERNEATRVAWSMKGVNSVDNNITLV